MAHLGKGSDRWSLPKYQTHHPWFFQDLMLVKIWSLLCQDFLPDQIYKAISCAEAPPVRGPFAKSVWETREAWKIWVARERERERVFKFSPDLVKLVISAHICKLPNHKNILYFGGCFWAFWNKTKSWQTTSMIVSVVPHETGGFGNIEGHWVSQVHAYGAPCFQLF